MDETNQTINAQPEASAPQPMAVPPAVEAPVAPQPMPMGQPSFASNFIRTIDWLLVGMGVLSSAALYFAIYYYKNKIIFDKSTATSMQTEIDSLQTDVSALKKATAQATTSVAGF